MKKLIIGLLVFLLVMGTVSAWWIKKKNPDTLQGDINGDCKVDENDLKLFEPHFGARRGDWNFVPCFDLNQDDKLNVLDLIIIGANYGKSC